MQGNISGKSGKTGGVDINGIIKQYKVSAGENVSAGSFVNFISSLSEGNTSSLDYNTGTASGLSATALSPSKVFVAYGRRPTDDTTNTKSQLCGIICTINENEIILSDESIIIGNNYSGLYISVVALDENRVFIAHSYGTSHYLYGVTCTIDNTTITVGKDVMLYDTTLNTMTAKILSKNKVFVVFAKQKNNPRAIVCEINDTTINKGTSISLGSYALGSTTSLSADSLSENKIIVTYGVSSTNGGSFLNGIICTIDGTIITSGSGIQLDSAGYSGNTTDVVALSENKVVIFHSFSSNYYKNAMICTIDGTIIKKEKENTLINEQPGTFSVVKSSSNNINIIYSKKNSENNTFSILHVMNCIINKDNTVAIKYNLKLNSINSEIGTKLYDAIPLLGNKLFITYKLISDYDPRGIVCTINDVVKSLTYSDNIDGVAKTSGTEGQTIEVYVPEVTI